MIIQKYTETMTPRERVRRTFSFETTDRVTIGYETNPVIHTKLCEALGIPNNDYEALLRALGVDYRPIGAPYIGKLSYYFLETSLGSASEIFCGTASLTTFCSSSLHFK